MHTLKPHSWGYLLPCFFTYSLTIYTLLLQLHLWFPSTSRTRFFSNHPEIKESLQGRAQSSSQIFQAAEKSSFSYEMQVSPLHQTFCNQYCTRLLKAWWVYRQRTAATSTMHQGLLLFSIKSWKTCFKKWQFLSPGLLSDSSLQSYFFEGTLFIYSWHFSPVPSTSMLKQSLKPVTVSRVFHCKRTTSGIIYSSFQFKNLKVLDV